MKKEGKWSNFICLHNASLRGITLRKRTIWLPEEYRTFRFLLNTAGNCTKMSCVSGF